MGADAQADLFYGTVVELHRANLEKAHALVDMDEDDVYLSDVLEALAEKYRLVRVYFPSYDEDIFVVAIPGHLFSADWDGTKFLGEELPVARGAQVGEARQRLVNLLNDLEVDLNTVKIGWHLMASYG